MVRSQITLPLSAACQVGFSHAVLLEFTGWVLYLIIFFNFFNLPHFAVFLPNISCARVLLQSNVSVSQVMLKPTEVITLEGRIIGGYLVLKECPGEWINVCIKETREKTLIPSIM